MAHDISAGTEGLEQVWHENASMNRNLSITANLLGDPGRAAMLLRLMGGMALPAGELAVTANVAPQTASEHLAKLVEGRLLSVERQGRHRYYRLASVEVADAVEALLVLTARPQTAELGAASSKAIVGSLEHARTCYGHLAGWLGVRITESLEKRGLIKEYSAKAYSLTASGREWFETIGVDVPSFAVVRNKLARRCLDWTERRHHLAGTLGCAMYKRFRELRWVAPVRDSRAVRVSVEGRAQLWELLRVPLG
jgi:DNA-binding transcriptional ArsR family regulator